jgi:uncharacterized protein YutD
MIHNEMSIVLLQYDYVVTDYGYHVWERRSPHHLADLWLG